MGGSRDRLVQVVLKMPPDSIRKRPLGSVKKVPDGARNIYWDGLIKYASMKCAVVPVLLLAFFPGVAAALDSSHLKVIISLSIIFVVLVVAGVAIFCFIEWREKKKKMLREQLMKEEEEREERRRQEEEEKKKRDESKKKKEKAKKKKEKPQEKKQIAKPFEDDDLCDTQTIVTL
ncbi:hypothetical protein RB195_010613 [Necator americanus]|uniref:Uncharacterized protein n=1 Tax=Necator americanus TaxID=51031 RepID=A0ABR1CYS2_NECAM